MNKIAEKSIKKYCDELETIFASINAEVCSKCSTEDGGCCKNCKENNGYFKHELFYNWDRTRGKYHIDMCCNNGIYDALRWHLFEEINQLKKEYVFDEQDGFLDKEKKCCRLPRWKRSITCLAYVCSRIKLSPDGRVGELIDKIKKIRIKHCIAV